MTLEEVRHQIDNFRRIREFALASNLEYEFNTWGEDDFHKNSAVGQRYTVCEVVEEFISSKLVILKYNYEDWYGLAVEYGDTLCPVRSLTIDLD